MSRRAAPSLLPQAGPPLPHPIRVAFSRFVSGHDLRACRKIGLHEGAAKSGTTAKAPAFRPVKDRPRKGPLGPAQVLQGARFSVVPNQLARSAFLAAAGRPATPLSNPRRLQPQGFVSGHDFSRAESAGAQRLPCCRRPPWSARAQRPVSLTLMVHPRYNFFSFRFLLLVDSVIIIDKEGSR